MHEPSGHRVDNPQGGHELWRGFSADGSHQGAPHDHVGFRHDQGGAPEPSSHAPGHVPGHAFGGDTHAASGGHFPGHATADEHGLAEHGNDGHMLLIAPHPGADPGSGDAAWAGSFENALMEHLPADLFGADAGAHPILIVPIDHLDINTFNIFNTLVENTNVLLDAANGGQIDIGGSVNALSSQTALIDASTQHMFHFG